MEFRQGFIAENHLRRQLLEVASMIFPCQRAESRISKKLLDEWPRLKGGSARSGACRLVWSDVIRGTVIDIAQNQETAGAQYP